jgi:hypothetical protein
LAKLWAFWMMSFAHKPLSNIPGLQFYKLLGSGKDGFNPLPDWSVYGLLQIWDTEKEAQAFFSSSKLVKKYQKKSVEQWTIYMKCATAKGEWSGRNPFGKSSTLDDDNPFISVITRATIKPRMLFKFWKYVPTSQQPLLGNEGLIYTKGIGEVPFLQMATFSIWRNKTSLLDFAYNSKEHQKAIQMTRQLDWYKEELFSRFQPYRSIGNWNGKNPLPELKN